jgi:hypothetical protein
MAPRHAPSPPPATPQSLRPLLEWLSRAAAAEDTATARELAEMVWLASRLPPREVEASMPAAKLDGLARQGGGSAGPLPPPGPDPSPAPAPPPP